MSTKRLLSVCLGTVAAALTPHAQQTTHPQDPPSADVICFAEGTPEAYVRQRNAALIPSGSFEFNLASRWSGSQGTPRTVTWSLVPDGLNIPNGVGEGSGASTMFAMLDADFAAQGGRAAWINRIQQSFDRWEEISGLTFVRRTSGGNDWDDGASWNSSGNSVRGDIRIGGKGIDGNNGILAYASYPSNGNMVLDVAENWGSSTNQNRFMRNIVTHEAGHALGIQHICSSNGVYLMEPFLTTSIDGPYHDDIRAIQRHYGDPSENDNSVGTASDLGTLPTFLDVGQLPPTVTNTTPPNSSILSLDTSFESDWFVFNVAENTDLIITVTPLGVNYDDSDQNGNGSCASGNFLDSRLVGDPDVTLFNAAGTTVIASSTSGGAGVVEQIVTSVSAGDYSLQVNNDTSGNIQLYDLEIDATPLPMCGAPASVTGRNAGTNPTSYTASAPVLGGTVSFVVIENYSNGLMFAYNSPLSLILGNGQALLAGGTFLFSKTIVGLPFGSASQSVPTNPALCGATAYTQVILTGPTAGGPGFQLTNAQDITIGF